MKNFIIIIAAKNAGRLIPATRETRREKLKCHPGVLSAAIKLLDALGIPGTSEMSRASQTTPVLLVGVCSAGKIISEACPVRDGYYLIERQQTVSLDEIMREVQLDTARTPASLMRKAANESRPTAKTQNQFQTLSGREKEVLTFLARGLNYREIAGELAIEPETVRCYVKKFCRKLSVRNRMEAVGKYCASLTDDEAVVGAAPGDLLQAKSAMLDPQSHRPIKHISVIAGLYPCPVNTPFGVLPWFKFRLMRPE